MKKHPNAAPQGRELPVRSESSLSPEPAVAAPQSLSSSTATCGCRESYPQLVPGKVSHGPGCQLAGGASSSTGAGNECADRMEWLADKIPAYGDYAKEAAIYLMQYAHELRARVAPSSIEAPSAQYDPMASFDKCDGGLPCMNTTTGCKKGQCSRKNYRWNGDGTIIYTTPGAAFGVVLAPPSVATSATSPASSTAAITDEMVERGARRMAGLVRAGIIEKPPLTEWEPWAGSVRAVLEAACVAPSAKATKSDIRCPVCGWVCEEADREES